jgi:hypothetical protein
MSEELKLKGSCRDNFKYFNFVGCVYPTGTDDDMYPSSYYVDCNIDTQKMNEYIVRCNDGYFFGFNYKEE